MNNAPTPYELARDKYRVLGIDTDSVINHISHIRLSLSCPDIDAGYLKKALSKAFMYIPAGKKISLSPCHAGDGGSEPRSFQEWVDWARKNDSGIDLRIPCPAGQNGIADAIRYRKLGEYFGQALSIKTISTYVFKNFDGRAVNPLSAAANICSSLDTLFSDSIPPAYMLDVLAAENGNSDLLLAYALKNNKAISITADKDAVSRIPSLMLFTDEISIVFRNGQYADEIARTLVRSSLLGRTHITIAPDDFSEGAVVAWTALSRTVLKALLKAMLEPSSALKKLEASDDRMSLYVISEELEAYPLKQIWEQLLAQNNVPSSWLKDIRKFESECRHAK